MRTCSLPDCDRPHKGRGYCQRHLYRLRRYGDPRDSRSVSRADYGATLRCTKCGETRPIDYFYVREGGRRRRKCKACFSAGRAAATAALQADDPLWRKRRDWALRNKYGLGIDEFEQIEQTQGGVCALCGQRPEYGRRRGNGDAWSPLHVDHDHETGQVRGLLCSRCNWWLGYFEETFADASRVLAYLGR